VSTRVDPAFLGKLGRYGAFDITACFNCGNCTAVCPLSTGNDAFPRRMIRYGQIGAEERLLGCKEVWQCYYCGECSETCPRQAEPGEFMAAARRYAIASCDPTGISRLLYTSKLFTIVFLLALSALLAAVLLTGHGKMAASAPQLFGFRQSEGFLSYQVVHNLGLLVILVAVIATVVGILRMARRLSGSIARPPAATDAQPPGRRVRIIQAARAVSKELAVHRSFRDCQEQPKTTWYTGRRFIHWAIMWGFIGLLIATGLDWLLDMTVGKDPGQPVALWHPTRLLGTVAGVLMVYGTGASIIQRWTRPDKYFAHSLLSDWLFLWLLFLAGVTGFVVEVAVYLPSGANWMYVALLVHVVVSMEVVLLLPFTKFAHAVYRPVALFLHNYLKLSAA
jgi:nitrate reductase gamma subunit/ferredoxin